MKLTFLGHAACMIETAEHRLLIDPFLKDNPLCDIDPADVKCDYILLTHGHADHVGDTESIAKANDATVIANYELSSFLEAKGLKTHPLHIGGGAEFPFGRAQLTIAFHGSSYPDENGLPIYMGMPGGLLIESDGKKLYHAGDTALTLEMELLGRRHDIDLALLPIGDNFTMGVHDALDAIDMIKPKAVVPIHFNTFPYIEVDPTAFIEGAAVKGVAGHLLKCGDQIDV
ncbi:metal-dependent hydrolase [Rubellicoccus peritrichatus]|uniref:UPF0173 metal-dependent hydrolase RZN69_08390 n=1 Tax=Rubellicoccus peritrichatus TaxID=3080537 RepID=A0AAQ3QXQ8_9BACT|nr:metal-dependent hydrolase [Puniceicoccus sp. CR14]WOO43110.1 metal-dependent hydrolase [Puniceicoccus sp. CR14]